MDRDVGCARNGGIIMIEWYYDGEDDGIMDDKCEAILSDEGVLLYDYYDRQSVFIPYKYFDRIYYEIKKEILIKEE
jgi:hypothetical protein